ncbi:MAG: hypothetical protein K6348_09925, partial [Deferribacterales bacterium]
MRKIFIFVIILFILILNNLFAAKPVKNIKSDYCVVPPFLPGNTPPLVLFIMGKDHKLFYEAYNDAMDLDGDGMIDVGYKHDFNYYGYFDPYKCYKYESNIFKPKYKTNDKYCNGDAWSGNLLNWMTMSRMD